MVTHTFKRERERERCVFKVTLFYKVSSRAAVRLNCVFGTAFPNELTCLFLLRFVRFVILFLLLLFSFKTAFYSAVKAHLKFTM